jgi:hypothetical protein
VLLASDGYRPDKENDARLSDIVKNEVVGKGYKAGGQTIDIAVVVSDGFKFSLGGCTWPQASIAARFAVCYRDSGGRPDESELIALIDFGDVVSSSHGNFELTASSIRNHA